MWTHRRCEIQSKINKFETREEGKMNGYYIHLLTHNTLIHSPIDERLFESAVRPTDRTADTHQIISFAFSSLFFHALTYSKLSIPFCLVFSPDHLFRWFVPRHKFMPCVRIPWQHFIATAITSLSPPPSLPPPQTQMASTNKQQTTASQSHTNKHLVGMNENAALFTYHLLRSTISDRKNECWEWKM